jgi:16S rRNA (adenine1518-N6/adenine1519-N6)-dimethyltransferase
MALGPASLTRVKNGGVKPKQSLGQNFLIDENIVKNIVSRLHLSHDDAVLEVGAGRGALTSYLAGKTQLVVVEIDGRVIDDLKRRFTHPDLIILHEDFLETDLVKWHHYFRSKLRVVGNIPYHLTSPILIKIFDAHSSVRDLTIMIQREVARRLVAKPRTKEYGILSVYAQFYGKPQLLFNVSPNCFYPKPKVTSTVLQISLFDPLPHHVDEDLFRLIVRTAFGKRRKTLRNSLGYLPLEAHVIEQLLRTSPVSLDQRAEDLNVDDFVALCKHVSSLT